MILPLLHQAISIQDEKAKAVYFFNPIDPEYTSKKVAELESDYQIILDKLTIVLNKRAITPEINPNDNKINNPL